MSLLRQPHPDIPIQVLSFLTSSRKHVCISMLTCTILSEYIIFLKFGIPLGLRMFLKANDYEIAMSVPPIIGIS